MRELTTKIFFLMIFAFSPAGSIDSTLLAQEVDFPALLDELQNEPDVFKRGLDLAVWDLPKNIGNRVVRLVGGPETYDPYGSQALRDTVIERWRQRWAREGDSMLKGLRSAPNRPGRQQVHLGDDVLTRDMPNMRTFYFLNNGRMFEMGTMDGDFPPLGRLLGDQSGIWAPPFKALDGVMFTLKDDREMDWPLTDSGSFTHDFSSATFKHQREGVRVKRVDFFASSERAYFSQITINNRSGEDRRFVLNVASRVNIRPAWRTQWQFENRNGLDGIRFLDGLVFAHDPQLEQSGILFGGDRQPSQHGIDGNTVTCSYAIDIPANESTTITFLVYAGLSEHGVVERERFKKLIDNAEAQRVHSTQERRDRVFGGTRFTCSDREVTGAYYMARATLELLTADMRPFHPAKFCYAGVPYYLTLFSADNGHSLAGITAAGMWELSGGALTNLAAAAKKQGNIVPHETAIDATHVGDGNTQETPQFIAACWRYYQWTGDRQLLEQLYPQAKECLRAVRAKFDTRGDGFLNGLALMELANVGPMKLDPPSHLHDALIGMAEMAAALGYNNESEEYRSQASSLRERINRDWWGDEQQMWADNMNADGKRRFDGHWTVVFPLLTGVADWKRGRTTLRQLEDQWVNQWGAVGIREPYIRHHGTGVVTTGLFAAAAFEYQSPDFGWKMIRRTAQASRQDRMLGAFTETIPPGNSDFLMLWSTGPYLQAMIEGLAGVRPDAGNHRADFFPQLPKGMDWFKLEDLRIGDHGLTLEVRKQGDATTIAITHSEGNVPLSGRVFFELQGHATIDGAETNAIEQPWNHTGEPYHCIGYQLEPGATVIVKVHHDS